MSGARGWTFTRTPWWRACGLADAAAADGGAEAGSAASEGGVDATVAATDASGGVDATADAAVVEGSAAEASEDAGTEASEGAAACTGSDNLSNIGTADFWQAPKPSTTALRIRSSSLG